MFHNVLDRPMWLAFRICLQYRIDVNARACGHMSKYKPIYYRSLEGLNLLLTAARAIQIHAQEAPAKILKSMEKSAAERTSLVDRPQGKKRAKT